MILEIADKIEAQLKSNELVGKRIGSGFCFLDNSRDVQFEYNSKEVKDYFSKIEEVIKNVSSQYEDIEINLRFRKDDFSFYVKNIKKPENDGQISEAHVCKEDLEEDTEEEVDNKTLNS